MFLLLEFLLHLSHGRFGRLEVIPLLNSATGGTGSRAGGTGHCKQGSSSHRLDRLLDAF